jgi:D-amino peptidase
MISLRRSMLGEGGPGPVRAQLACIPGVTLRDSRTAQVTGAMPDLFRMLSVFISVAVALTGQPPYC